MGNNNPQRNIIRAATEKIIIASGPVIVEDNKTLLDKHGETKFWKFCGGTVKEEEGLFETARREAREELGIDIELINDTPFVMTSHKEQNGKVYDVILVHFLCKRIGDIKPGDDIREWAWLDLADLPNDLAPNIKPALEYFKFI